MTPLIAQYFFFFDYADYCYHLFFFYNFNMEETGGGSIVLLSKYHIHSAANPLKTAVALKISIIKIYSNTIQFLNAIKMNLYLYESRLISAYPAICSTSF